MESLQNKDPLFQATLTQLSPSWWHPYLDQFVQKQKTYHTKTILISLDSQLTSFRAPLLVVGVLMDYAVPSSGPSGHLLPVGEGKSLING
jgi:hypothetical protein